MAEAIQIKQLSEAISELQFPSVTIWNRLEGRPRTAAFDRALRAEVRDALWFLSRQWQLGEFHGEDAGSPVLAKVHLERSTLTRFQPGEHPPEAFDGNVPLEAQVERRPAVLGLDVRLALGRYWLKLAAAIGDYRQAYLDEYAITEPDASLEGDAPRAAHPEVWQAYAAAAGRAMDGGALLTRLRRSSSNRASDDIDVASPADAAALDAAGDRFVAWAARVFCEPPASGEDSWTPERMEYRFACSAPSSDGEQVYAAAEYHGGSLDWYAVDVQAEADTLDPLAEGSPPPEGQTFTALPTAVQFDGMPNARWWAFEDSRTNLGKVGTSTTDLPRMLFLEFALVFSNDWFVLPCTLNAGSVAAVRGMAITNVFGERTWVEPAGRGDDDDWARWSAFTLTVDGPGHEPADRRLLLLPTVPKIQESEPFEEVRLVHDEMANMAWAVEHTVPLPSGESKPGAETGLETRAYFVRLRGGPTPTPAFDTEATIRYEAMNTIPEQWIPLIPVRVPGSERSIQLQRGALPRFIDGDRFAPTGLVRPRTGLMREGLDAATPAPYFLYEEEVPRSGARVTQSWQRTRWHGGRVALWVGARKGIGRPPASSGLAFDQAVDLPRA